MTIGREAARRISAFQTWCYRNILKINRRNVITIKVFDRITEKPTLLKQIGKFKSKFSCQIVRSIDRKLFVNIMEGIIYGNDA